MLLQANKKKQIKTLLQAQETNITDDYTVGVYNGLELALAVLEDREPEFKFYDKKPEIYDLSEEKEASEEILGRTVKSGVKRRCVR